MAASRAQATARAGRARRDGRLRRWWLTPLTYLCLHCAMADPAVDAPAASRTVAALLTHEAPRLLYLEIYINGQPTQTIAAFREQHGRLAASRADLQQAGVRPEALAAADGSAGQAQEQLPLDHIRGLQYRYDESRQVIELSLSDAIRAPNQLGGNTPPPAAAAASTGLVFNYDAFLRSGAGNSHGTSLAAWSEQRLFGPLGVLDNTGTASSAAGARHYVRLDSAWHYDDPARLLTGRAGDTTSSALSWSRAVRLGGLQIERNFALRPDLVTFPVPALSGSAAVPSSVDLYVNNVRQFSSSVPSGPFIINTTPAITGAGMATLVVRDALGREVTTTLPVYVDSRMLGAGLSSFSLEGGFLRRNYALSSFDYDRRAVGSGSLRYGWSEVLTLESHGEAGSGLFNAGSGALVRLGRWGVLNAAASGSLGKAAGNQASLGYQLVLPALSLSAQSTRTFRDYRDLASQGGTPPPRAQDQATLSLPLGGNRTIGLSYVHLDSQASGRSSIGSLLLNCVVARQLSLYANAYQDFDHRQSRGVNVGLSLDLGGRSALSANGGRSQGQGSFSTSLSHSADYDGGWEWGLQQNQSGSMDRQLASTGYLGRYGELQAAAERIRGGSTLSLEDNGGLVFMDGVLEPSRRIFDSFALVSTDGLAGIPVLHENRVIGATDAGGHLLIPDLNAYEHNHVGIDSMVLPPDANVPLVTADLAPRSQSGVLARFPVKRYAAASVILVDGKGAVLPPGTLLRHRESGRDYVLGYDGLGFIEELQPHNHLQARGKDFTCEAEFEYRAAEYAEKLPTLGPLSCRPDRGVQ
jgi:outer membrane usher protein